MRRLTMVLAVLTTLSAAGCGGDIAQQLVSNEQLRNQVMDALVSHKELAMQAVDKMLASDSLRIQVVDHMLTNDNGARQVIGRIATNANALDLVLAAAVRDSAMRVHVVTLVKGMTMVQPKKPS